MLTRRSEIEKDIRKVFGAHRGLMSEKEIKEYSAIGKDAVKTLISGLPCFGEGRGKRYAIVDVAERMAECVNS